MDAGAFHKKFADDTAVALQLIRQLRLITNLCIKGSDDPVQFQGRAGTQEYTAFSGLRNCKVAKHAAPSVEVRPLISGTAVSTAKMASQVRTRRASTLLSEEYHLCGAHARSRMLWLMTTFSSDFF